MSNSYTQKFQFTPFFATLNSLENIQSMTEEFLKNVIFREEDFSKRF